MVELVQAGGSPEWTHSWIIPNCRHKSMTSRPSSGSAHHARLATRLCEAPPLLGSRLLQLWINHLSEPMGSRDLVAANIFVSAAGHSFHDHVKIADWCCNLSTHAATFYRAISGQAAAANEATRNRLGSTTAAHFDNLLKPPLKADRHSRNQCPVTL